MSNTKKGDGLTSGVTSAPGPRGALSQEPHKELFRSGVPCALQ